MVSIQTIFAQITQKKISVDFNGQNLKLALKEIKRKSGASVLWRTIDFANTKPVHFKGDNLSVTEVLDSILLNQPVTYGISGNILLFSIRESPVPVQPKDSNNTESIVTGQVLDEREKPIEGATVAVPSCNQITATDENGSFTFNNICKKDKLIVTYVGFLKQEVNIKNTGFVTIKLIRSPKDLKEIIVSLGYYNMYPKRSTGNVTIINSSQLQNQATTDPIRALDGLVPGLNITPGSGMNSSSSTMELRGHNSIGIVPGEARINSLYMLLNDVPYVTGNTPLNQQKSVIGNPDAGAASVGLNPLNSINSADIESMEILKDADATAIYGSRGANGVIRITTKKGKSGKPKLTLDFSKSWEWISTRLNLLETSDYLDMRRNALKNDGLVPNASNAPDLVLWDSTRYTDWQKELIGGTAHLTMFNAALSGGDSSILYRISGSFRRETTVFPADLADKNYSLNASIGYISKSKRVTIGMNLVSAINDNDYITSDLTTARTLAPNAPDMKDANGNPIWVNKIANPYANLKNKYDAHTHNIINNLKFSYKISDSLIVSVNMGMHLIQTKEKSVYPMAAQNPALQGTGSVYEATNAHMGWIVEPQIDYKHRYKGFSFNYLLGVSLQGQENKRSSLELTGYTNDAFLNVQSSAASVMPWNATIPYRYEALYARVHIGWKNLLLNCTGRRDGSSRFGPASRFGNFGAVGTAWIFSDEEFIQKRLPFLSFGKIRSSYGLTGNDQVKDFLYLHTWSPVQTAQLNGGSPGLTPNGLYNPSFGWELNTKLEAALEFEISRLLHFEIVAYLNRSTNLLVKYLVPSQAGDGAIPAKNFDGVIVNKALEIAIQKLKWQNRQWQWACTFLLTIPRNILASFPGLEQSPYANRLVEKESLSVQRWYRLKGVNPVSGLYEPDDVNQDGVIDEGDYITAGNKDARYFASLSGSVSYKKSFEISFTFDCRNQTGTNPLYYLFSNAAPGNTNSLFFTNQPVDITDRWMKPGDIATFQKVSSTRNSEPYGTLSYYKSSDKQLTNASYIRLKSICFSWELPKKVLGKLHLSSCKIYLKGQNLFTITPYKGTDPITQNISSLPALKIANAGFTIKLK